MSSDQVSESSNPMGQLGVVLTQQHHRAEVFQEEVKGQGGGVNGYVFMIKSSHAIIVDFGCSQYIQPRE